MNTKRNIGIVIAAILVILVFAAMPGATQDVVSIGVSEGATTTPNLNSGEYEIAYDDGTPETSWGVVTLCGHFAVNFTVTDPPGVPCQLVKARFWLKGDSYPTQNFEVVVFHADRVTEYTRFKVPGATGEGWYEVEFDPPITIDEPDFYIAIHYLGGESYLPFLGEDTDGTSDNRSYKGHTVDGPWPMELWIDHATQEPEDWMIRAVVTGKTAPPVSALTPAGLIALVSLLSAIATVAIVRKRH